MSSVSGARMMGPLGPFVLGFREELVRQGYRPATVVEQLRLMAYASRWLARRGLGAGDLTPVRVEQLM